MKTTYTIHRPGAAPETGEIDWPEKPGYDRLDAFLRPLLDGGDLEHVFVLLDGRTADMFVDERGHSKGLPRNEAATAIYRAATLARQPKIDPESLSIIVGPAVVFDRVVWF